MLALRRCSHQFSWPRRSSAGQYYQICVLCGDEYSYDWDSMRRLGPKPPEPVIIGAPQKRGTRWSPRERRMRLSGPVRYREVGTDSWNDGELRNLSKSGLLFAGSCSLPQGTRIEMELEMPSEICGSIGRQVRCVAQVVRIGSGETANLCAAQVFDYVFVDNRVMKEVAPRISIVRGGKKRCGRT